MIRSLQRATGALFALVVVTGLARAGQVNEDHGIAIKGYDAVAYFTDGKPIKGSPAHKFVYKGVTYEFVSAAHRKLFAAMPDKYTPQFGGFCAYGTALGHKADIDPAAFTIVDGKLYLNYNAKVQETWKQDIPGYLKKADDAWPEVSQQPDVKH